MDPGGSGGEPATAAGGGPAMVAMAAGGEPATAAGGGPAMAAADALALARSLLPTIHHPAIEYNLPVMDVQRY
jgi:hypothetical protein